MIPDEFRLTCIELFGKRWQIGCARFLKKPNGTHVNVRTVRRWWKTDSPFWVEALLKAEQARRLEEKEHPIPEPVAVILNREAKRKGVES